MRLFWLIRLMLLNHLAVALVEISSDLSPWFYDRFYTSSRAKMSWLVSCLPCVKWFGGVDPFGSRIKCEHCQHPFCKKWKFWFPFPGKPLFTEVSEWEITVFEGFFCGLGPFSHDRSWKFPQVKGNYPPNKRGNLSHPSKNHFSVDDFPGFPSWWDMFPRSLEGNIFRYTNFPLNHACERTSIENFPTISREKTWAYNGTGNLPPRKKPKFTAVVFEDYDRSNKLIRFNKNLENVSTETGLG